MKSVPKGEKKSHNQKENPNYNVFPTVFATSVWLLKIGEKKEKRNKTFTENKKH